MQVGIVAAAHEKLSYGKAISDIFAWMTGLCQGSSKCCWKCCIHHCDAVMQVALVAYAWIPFSKLGGQVSSHADHSVSLTIVLLSLQADIVAAAYERLSYGRAINAIQALSARGNLFLQERQPWTAFKKVNTKAAFALLTRDRRSSLGAQFILACLTNTSVTSTHECCTLCLFSCLQVGCKSLSMVCTSLP